MILGLSYHYIGDENKYPLGGIYPFSPENFSGQLDILARSFVFLSQEDLLNAVHGKKALPERGCVITFDDGLMCQYQNALPILLKKGTPAFFFVNSYPITDKKVCLTHKIHWVRSVMGEKDFYDSVNLDSRTVTGFSMEEKMRGEPSLLAKKKYGYDRERDAIVKFFLNNVVSQIDRERIVDIFWRKAVSDEEAFTKEFYMGEEQIRHLYNLGMIGLHSHRHVPFGTLSDDDLRADLEKNKAIIEKIAGGKVNSISYPHGEIDDKVGQISNICRTLGIEIGFTMERAINDGIHAPLFLSRVDSNDIPGGKRPAISFDSGTVTITDPARIKKGRSRYIFES